MPEWPSSTGPTPSVKYMRGVRAKASINRIREYRLRTNSQRLRGPIGPKQSNVTRIIALGDSVTHGWGGRKRVLSLALQAMLQTRGHGGGDQRRRARQPGVCDATLVHTGCAQPPTRCRDLDRRLNQQGPTLMVLMCGLYKTGRTGAKMIVALPPISSFDVKGSQAWQNERDQLQRRLASAVSTVIDLTPHLRAAGQGRGEVLIQQGGKLAVFDQESKRTWLEAMPTPHDLPQEIYTLFEHKPMSGKHFLMKATRCRRIQGVAEALIPSVEAVLPA